MPLLSCYFHGHGSEEEYVVCTSHRVIEFEGQFELAHVEFTVYGFDPEAQSFAGCVDGLHDSLWVTAHAGAVDH